MASNTDAIVEIGYDESIPLLHGHEEHVNNAEATEHYLQELFRTECEYKISQDVVDRIQKFTESCVHNLIKPIVESLENVNAYDETRLLKVGSFYDGTKNAYPDEFDYILVLAEINGSVDKRAKKQLEKLSDSFHKRLKRSVENHNLPDLPFQYLRLHGPASKLALYVPISVSAEVNIVSIDISVAFRLRLQNEFRRDLNVRFNDWGHIIESSRSFLLMKKYQRRLPKSASSVRLTITESEKHYMLTSMSEKHKKVYRLLKLLINGNEGNEEVRHLVRQLPNRSTCKWIVNSLHKCIARSPIESEFSSYAIKCLVFLHVQCCKNETSRVTECIIQALGTLLERFQTELNLVSEMTFFSFYRNNSFSVCVEKVYGDFLRVADEFGQATDIADVVEDLIIGLRTCTEIGHENRQTTVCQRVGNVKNVLKKQKVPLLSKTCSFTYFICFYFTVNIICTLFMMMGFDREFHLSYSAAFNVTIDNFVCVSSNQNKSDQIKSYSLPCKTYYCLPDQRFTDLRETNKNLFRNCDPASTMIGLFNHSSNSCDELCTTRFTTNTTEVTQKAEEVKRCCLLTDDDYGTARFLEMLTSFLFLYFNSFLVGSFLILLAICYIQDMKKKWKQRQHYREIRGKITATLNSLKEE